MNIRQLVHDECANYSNGHCDGVTAFNERFRKPGGCRVIDGERCEYFESSVAPVILQVDPVNEAGLRRRQAQAMTNYKGAIKTAGNTCRDCGKDIKARKRYCPECREKRRKNAVRGAVSRHREKAEV